MIQYCDKFQSAKFIEKFSNNFLEQLTEDCFFRFGEGSRPGRQSTRPILILLPHIDKWPIFSNVED